MFFFFFFVKESYVKRLLNGFEKLLIQRVLKYSILNS